jgi:uncharacterized membrane protein
MQAYVLDWLNLLGRWMHIIFGIAWIGASFYFVWLDNHLEEPKDEATRAKGVGGEIWSVHGGGFYNAQKYRVAPELLPQTLHWFKWEAYWTWMSGFFMLCLVYYVGADAFLIDPQVAQLTQFQAIAIGLASLIGGWVVYDLLCRSRLGSNERVLAAVIALLVGGAAYGLCHVFSGRGAFIHFGAILGTIMAGNVLMVIIPGQRELVRAKQQGRDPDPAHAVRGKQRSVHNTYFTLPVLFTMISNHYAMTYGAPANWLVLWALSIAGAAIRVYFVARHKAGSRASPVPLLAGVALIAACAAALAPHTGTATAKVSSASQFVRVQEIVATRCATCHAAAPTQPGFIAAPNGVMLDSAERIIAQKDRMHIQLVSKAMPLANLTHMTDDERALVIAWIEAGAPH